MSSRRTFLRSAALLTSSVLLVLTGCGLGDISAPLASTAAEMSGVIHGGPNAVIGAAVTIYATTSVGYGAAATQLATTTSGSYGQFSFTRSSYTCPAGQYAYITAVGGNSGAGVNSNAVLMAALGPCSTVTQNTSVNVSEATTVAAVYALGNFTSLSGTTVNIGAPARNNAAINASLAGSNGGTVAACTAASGTTAATCTAAGLGHAFQNALNLADSAEQGTFPTGQVYAVTPSNANGSIPQAMLNAVADAVFTCINSNGGTAADTSTNCGKLFSYTTPPTTSVATPTVPTNTVGALLNLVKYPTLTPANVTSLFGLVPANAPFMPVLSAAPTDFSLALLYKGVTIGSTTTAFTYPYFVTLDFADNVFVASTTASSTGPLTILGLGSNGASLFNGYSSTTYIAPRMMATDFLSHVFVPNNSATAGSNVVLELSTADGSLTNALAAGGTGAPYGVAVDATNKVYYTLGTASTQALYSVLPGTSTTSTAVTPATNAYSSTYAPEALAFDASGNLWNQLYSSTAGTFTNYVANTGTIGAVAFGTNPATDTDSTTVSSGYGIVIDGSGNGWANNTKTLYEMSAAGTAPTATYTISYTAPGATAATTASSARYPAMDGNGNIFLPDNNAGSSKLWQFLPGTTNFIYMTPCAAPAGATACAAGSSAASGGAGAGSLYGPRNAQIDSTGSVWVSSSTNGDILQIIGTAAPTWPGLSLLKPGVRPQ